MTHDNNINNNKTNQREYILENALKHSGSSSWRDFNIISNKYYKQHQHKNNMDKVYEYRNSMKKLYDTNPYNPVLSKYKQPKREQNLLSLEQNDIDQRIKIWNKKRNNNFLHHKITKIDDKKKEINEYDSAKHPEVYHRGESMKNIRGKDRINPNIYKSLKRNHDIITNQAWKGRNSVDFPFGVKLKLKQPQF